MRLEKYVQIRMPTDKLEALIKKADEHGCGHSTYVRQLIYQDLLKPGLFGSSTQQAQ